MFVDKSFPSRARRSTISVRHFPSRTSPSQSLTSPAEEAFTSENWIVRIYQVKKEDPLGRDLKSANAFDNGKKRKRTKPTSRRRALAA